MVGDIAGVVEVVADAGVEVIAADQICASSMVVVAKLLKPVVEVIWSTMNVMPSATAPKLEMMTI